jgi:hypothetical protein
MRKKQIIIINLITAVFFALIFYKNYVGLNLFLFELAVIPLMFWVNKPVKMNKLTFAITGSVFLSAVMVVILNTSWSVFINILMLFTLSGVLAYQGFRSYIHAFAESFFRLFSSQISVLLDWKQPKMIESKAPKVEPKMSLARVFYLIVIPIAILIVFIILYSTASSKFYAQFEDVFSAIARFFENIDFLFLIMVIFGTIVANALFMKTNPVGLHAMDLKARDALIRTRRRNFVMFKPNALKTQYLSGVVILALLNALILYFNVLDFIYLWFGFTWDGSFLKEFVHEGTWILVFTVFLSAGIALFFFSRNINFLKNNTWLKRLTIIWIAQNIVMVVSVVLRNYWYIQYFGLAYKRIAVLFFLLLTIIGLISIIIKVLNVKTSYFLWKINGFALLLVLVGTTCVNWDLVIAKHNFKHYDRSLIDYKFMSRLNNSALPYTCKSIDELEEINKVQEETMPFDLDVHRTYLWDIYTYQIEVLEKREKFLQRYSHMNWLEWNLADYQTYKKLTE